METEIVKVDPKEFGLEEKKGNEIAQSFSPKLTEFEAFRQMYEEIITKDLTKETCKEARELRLKLVKVRTGIAEVHKAEKAFYRAGGLFVDALKNKLTLPVEQMEEKLSEIEKYFENLEKERKQALLEERRMAFNAYGADVSFMPLADMTEDQFKSQLELAKIAFERKQEEERKAEEERLEREKLDKLEYDRRILIAPYVQFNTSNTDIRNMSEDDFQSLLKSLIDSKIEYEKEQESIRLENDRLKKEQEKKDEESKKEQARLAKIAEEERKKAEKLAKEKEEREAKERAEREAEENRKRDLENAGDKAKFKDFYEIFKQVEFPQLKNKEISDAINAKLEEVRKFMVEQAKKLV